ncbi:hypothetical protein KKG24_05320 [Patescibacteria group bacterium]|nr:hypothetical protein [Patescibacteria group bacterium]
MRNPSLRHQKLVAALITHLRTKLGYRIISASYENFNDPEKQGRHEPDIIAMDTNGILHIAEAKASYEDIFSETAKEQFIDFSNRVMTANNTPVPFHIVVYKEDEQFLISRLNQLGIGTLIGNRIKIWTL